MQADDDRSAKPEPSASSDVDGSAPPVAIAFLRRYLEDCAHGKAQALEFYQAAFPGFEEMVACEYARVTTRCSAALGTEAPTDRDGEPASSEGSTLADLEGYRLVKVLGEGGMGVVYLAEQEQPVRREVALKVLKPGMDSRELVARFEVERQALALMNHPGIAKVYDAGVLRDGRPYFTMEYVPGLTITDHCDRGRATVRQRLELFVEVCDAVQHAHQKAVLHRDLKSTNVLVEVDEGRPLPKIIDFGLAKAVGRERTDRTLYTQVGQMLGTPEYMSPEQAEGDLLDIDTRTDIYSLGVLLYELLAGVLPFEPGSLRGRPLPEVLRTIREVEPPAPSARLGSLGERARAIATSRSTEVRSLVRRLQSEPDWIVGKAMEKDRTLRYASASELAADIRRYLNQEAVLAGRYSTWHRTRKFLRRHRAGLAVAVVVAIGLMVGVAGLTLGLVKAREAESGLRAALANAEEEKSRADAAARDLSHRLYMHLLEQAKATYDRGDLFAMHELLKRCPLEERGWEWHRLEWLSNRAAMTLNHGNWVFCVDFSADGKRIVSGSQNGALKLWDAESGAEVLTLPGHKGEVWYAGFSPNGEKIASTGSDGMLRIWEARTGKELKAFRGSEVRGGVEAESRRSLLGSVLELAEGGGREYYDDGVCFSPDGTRLATGRGDKTVRLWDVETGEVLRTLRGHRGPVREVRFSPDGTLLASASDDGTVRLWDSASGEGRGVLSGHSGRVRSLDFSPDGKLLVSSGEDATLRLWEVDSGKERAVLRGHERTIDTVRFSPDGRHLASGSTDRLLKLWDVSDVAKARERFSLGWHQSLTHSVDFSPDGCRIVSGGRDGLVKLWDVAPETFTLTAKDESDLWSVTTTRDGSRVLSASGAGTVRVWDAASGEELMNLHHGQSLSTVSLSPDGTRILSAGHANFTGKNGVLKLWDSETGSLEATLEGQKGGIFGAAFSPDGERIVSGSGLWRLRNLPSAPKSVCVWDTRSGRLLHELQGHRSLVFCVAFSADGEHVASGSYDEDIRLWDPHSGRLLATLHGHTSGVRFLSFSPGGERLATCGRDGTVKVWDVSKREEIRGWRASRQEVFCVIYDSSGRRIVTGGDDGLVRIFEAESGEELLTLRSSSSPVRSVAFGPQDRALLAARGDGTIDIWEIGTPTQGYRARKRVEEASRHVNALREASGSWDEVFRRIPTESSLASQTREVALRLAALHAGYSANAQGKQSLTLVGPPGREPESYRVGLRMALEAHRRKPQNPGHLTVAGIAHYRLGELREAIAMLERAQELNAWARYPLHHAMNTLYLGVCREQLDARE